MGQALHELRVILSGLAVALVAGALIFAAAGANPLTAYAVMFAEPLKGAFGITEALVRAIPLLLVAAGVTISFRSGVFNIGGEGQIMIGTICSVAVALKAPALPAAVLLPLVFLAGFLGGGIWGGIAGWLKARHDVNEILGTVMLNAIAAQLYSLALRGPLIDPQEMAYGTGVPQTARIPAELWLGRLIPGMRLHTGVFLALASAVLVYLLLWRTGLGFEMRACGAGRRAARYAGMDVGRRQILAMVLAGGLAGLAGTVELCGVNRRALEGLSANYGFSGIVVALFGGLHPVGLVPASVLFGLLTVGSDMMQRSAAIPAHIVLAIQGLIVMAVVSSRTWLVRPEPVPDAVAPGGES